MTIILPILLGTAAAAQTLVNALQAVNGNAGNMLDAVWSVFLQGDLYGVVSQSVAAFTIIPMGIFVVNNFRNRNLTRIDQRYFTGDFIAYLLVGLILLSLFTPTFASSKLYSARNSIANINDRIVAKAQQTIGDPNAQMMTILASQASTQAGLSVCNQIIDPDKRKQCVDELIANNQPLINTIQAANTTGQNIPLPGPYQNIMSGAISGGASGAVSGLNSGGVFGGIWGALSGGVGGAFNGVADNIMLTLIIPTLFTIGSAFLVLLDCGLLLVCMFFPVACLFAIADAASLGNWFKKLVHWGLIRIAYQLCIISVAFAMLSLNAPDILMYALIAGIGAPWLSFKIAGNDPMGVVSGVGNLASFLVMRR
jgi:hypothetical protein